MTITINIPEQNYARQPLVDFCTAAHIIHLICSQCGVTPAAIEGKGRHRELAWARHLAIALIRRYTTMNLNKIALLFNRDFDSVRHAIRNVNDLIQTNPESFRQFQWLDALLRRDCPSSIVNRKSPEPKL